MRNKPHRNALFPSGTTAVVTGASSGIGRAIALALARHGVRLCLVGRNPAALSRAAAAAGRSSKVFPFQIDLASEENFEPLIRCVRRIGRLDFLIHSAGVIQENRMEQARIDDLDLQFATNVRAPYLLTQKLLPMLLAAHGLIVFLNSSAGLSAKRPDIGQYAATKHALRAVADSLREELNPKGVRVLSLYLGRVATPMQEAIFRNLKSPYRPERMLQPEDVASIVVHSLRLPSSVEITDISVRSAQKSQ